ncbi:MAG: hypothetical protein OXF41_03655 [bacterium]|nr:hypothetical protein [bacterium]
MREAVRTAKHFITEYFADEKIKSVGLEEIKYEGSSILITIGFVRPWDWSRNSLTGELREKRSYKVVRIGREGKVLSLMDRLLPE